MAWNEMGLMGSLGLTATGRLGGRWFGQAGSTALFGDCANLSWDFGVSSVQAARREELLAAGTPGLEPGEDSPYTPECGLREVRVTGVLGYALTPRLSLLGMTTGVRLEGERRTVRSHGNGLRERRASVSRGDSSTVGRR